jgi:DNA polymerase-3 subunit delta'
VTAGVTVGAGVAPVWRDLVGQEKVVAVLSGAVRSAAEALATARCADHPDRPLPGMTHAWLFTGPPGSGRSTAARAFAAALQCPDDGCGTCDACHTALAGTHADVDIVNTRKLSIGVDDARALVSRAARHPSGGRWQVMVVEDADRLTEPAANALLKAVEEPAPRTVWLLCAPSLEDALPTIRSRCRHVALRTPPTPAVAAVLVARDGIDPAMASFAARAAQGHIGRAKRLALDEESRLRRHAVLRLPQSLESLSGALAAAAELVVAATAEATDATAELDTEETEGMRRALGVGSGSRQPAGAAGALRDLATEQKRRATRSRRDALDRALVDLASFYRDVLAVQADAEVELVNEEMREAVTSVARTSGPDATLRRIDAVLAARTAIDANVAPLLAVEAMTVALRDG